ncbi:hypothetical protein GCM10022408_04410 [Hymenobacter fastidiosus]|uniref:N-acetyltransferase domain-containing protein n=1 Tax=Hymenobacter fastidiosus TaxID=486264 RepID=A0ABP7RFW6_9BACT
MSPAHPRLVFRADGNATIGLGHVTRCLALAAMLAPDFEGIFAIHDPGPAVLRQIRAICPTVLVVPAFATLAQEADWLLSQLPPGQLVVLDGYQFTADYQRRLGNRGQGLVYLDDLLRHYQWADVVINQAGGITPAEYRQIPGGELCLGPAYALLRPPFQAAAQRVETGLDLERIFLNMGGADPQNHTLRTLHQLRQRFPHKSLAVVTGAAYPHQPELARATSGLPGVYLYHNLGAAELADLLGLCGLHVCPPSGMAYECCAVGGLVLLHPIADNQQRLFTYLTEAGLARPLAELEAMADDALPELAHQLRLRQRAVFDGAAAQRFRRVFQQLHTAYQLTLRRAVVADARQYFEWANDSAVRSNALQAEPIAWTTHEAWFSRRLADADSFLYIFERAGQPVGQVRVEFAEGEGTIDYSVAAGFRGQGLGLAVLRRALGQLRHDKTGSWALLGQVKAANLPSARVFHRLGFAPLTPVRVHGEMYDVFRLDVTSAAE